MGLLSLTYSRPAYVSGDEFRRRLSSSTESSDKEAGASSLRSGNSKVVSGIPDSLSFEKVINGETCSPMTLRDFMNYLLYVEYAAENLQFYLWHQDYVERFNAAPTSDIALSPEWTPAMEAEVYAKLQREATEAAAARVAGPTSPIEAEIFKGTDFDKETAVDGGDFAISRSNPFATPPRTRGSENADRESTTFAPSVLSDATTTRTQANNAIAAAGASTPFTIQPYRGEISRIIATYLAADAPRQLNLSDRDRRAVLHALSYTTHPSALRIAFRVVDATLRKQAHPNFVRWSVCNGNPDRVWGARQLGYSGILFAFVVGIVLTLSHVGRGWRAFGNIFLISGLCAVVASHRGMCICMYAMHNRHIRPWEFFVDAECANGACEKGAGIGKNSTAAQSFESFGSSNSFEDEPWVVDYEKKSLMRKIFDKETWIEDPTIRTIQDTIFLQSLLIALAADAAYTALFVPLPAGNFF